MQSNLHIPSSLPARPIDESYWVVPGCFLAGEYPGNWNPELTRRRLDAFFQAGFETFIDLTRQGERETYQPILMEQAGFFGRQVKYQRLSIGDFGLPTHKHMKEILDTIDTALNKQQKIFVHCWGGIGRSGTVVGCYLVRHGKSGAEALEQLSTWWQDVPKHVMFPRSPETDEQVQFIFDWKE
jgi:hypothetical protein